MIDPWSLTSTRHDSERDNLLRRGNVFQLANGYMGYRGTLDEFGAAESVAVTLAGFFDRAGEAWREPVNAPNGGFTRLMLDGAELGGVPRQVRRHRQTLHFRNAVFERDTEFFLRGKSLRLQSQRFLSADQPHLGAIRLTLSSERAATVTLRTGIDFQIWDLNGPHLFDLRASRREEVLIVEGVTGEGSRRVAVAEAQASSTKDDVIEHQGQAALRVLTLRLAPGVPVVIDKFFTVVTERDGPAAEVESTAVELVRAAAAAGYDACLRRHNAIWERRWSRCDVTIEGDEDAQRALRYSVLQLLMAAPVTGSANSIPARALSGQVYKGAVFWDTEMFMFPFFLHTLPEIAADLLRYRIRTLDGARRKAATEGGGYRGAYYAWESQDTGDEACSYFNIGDPITGRELRTHFRDKQVHISGDIAIAMWEYFRVTDDDQVLLEGGAEVILECARFLFSYAVFKRDRRRYEMLDVVGPDEYHERVDNNAFTNLVARETFLIAGQLVRHLRRRHPRALRALLRKLKIEGELPRFREAARLLYVPEPDAKSGLIEQFEGYFRLRPAKPAELAAAKAHPHEYPGAGQGLAVPTQVIKQADVVMMLSLFRHRYDERVKRANWDYYEPRTEHGSSLSASAYALVAADFGRLGAAYEYFLQTAKIDLEAKYKVYVGTIYTGGSHPAANGGAWMTAVRGFGGVADDGRRLTLRPRLPAKWTRLQFALANRGGLFQVMVTPTTVTLTADAANQRVYLVEVTGRRVRCAPGKTVTVNYAKSAAAPRAA